jgi:hypothetical protein
MRNIFRKIWTFLWVNPKEESQRDQRTRRVHARTEKAIDEAEYLIESYRAADVAMRKHSKVWKNTNV